MKRITVIYGQTAEDLALLYYGCLEGVVLLMADNNIAVNDLLYAGQEILIRDPIPELTQNNLAIFSDLRFASIQPVTGLASDAPNTLYVDDEYVDDDYFQEL